MNLRLYGPRGSCPGGGEKYMDALAEALKSEHTVTQVDNPADANVVQSNEYGYGKKVAYVIQIPHSPINAASITAKCARGEFRDAQRDLGRKQLMIDAKHSKLVIVYSEFVKAALWQNHGIKATVLYPPVRDYSSTIEKKSVILSVGRFFEKRIYNHKRHDVLIDAFREFHKHKLDWELRLIGGAEESEAGYVASRRERSQGLPVWIAPNVSDGELRWHYGQARFYWHAAGYEAKKSEDCEHFGISIVEAMNADCIPLVHESGGPIEIIDSAWWLYWHSPSGLASRTQILSNLTDRQNESTRLMLRTRAAEYGMDKFTERALNIFRGLNEN